MNLNARNFVTSKAGLTGLSGAATTFTTAAAIVFCLLGKAFSKAAVAGGATPVVDFITNLAITLVANTGTAVLWCVDAAGNIRCVKGSTEALDASGNFINAPQLPIVPDTLAPFAYSIHKAGATTVGTWTFGVSNWNATGMTHSAADIMFIPSRPQIA